MLTLRVTATVGEGRAMSNDTPFQYEVDGLPSGQEAQIWKPGDSENWTMRPTVNGNMGDWEGAYQTAQDALDDLRAKL